MLEAKRKELMGVGSLDTNLDTRVSSSSTSLNQSEFDAREATGSESRGNNLKEIVVQRRTNILV